MSADVKTRPSIQHGAGASVSPIAGGERLNTQSETRETNGPFFPVEEMSSINPETMSGNGTWLNPLDATGGSGPGNLESFSYTVTGDEPDLANLVIALSPPRPNNAYNVFPAQQTSVNGLIMDVANDTKTTTHFVLSLSSEAAAGDIFSFLVANNG